MLVEKVMSYPAHTITRETTARQTAQLMAEKHIHCLVVLDADKKAVGLVASRDIVKNVIAKAKDPVTTPTQEFMSSPLISVHPKANIKIAIDTMINHKVKKLAVLQEETVVGVITAIDIMLAYPRMSQELVETWIKPVWR